jgi:hypothetical protein
MQNLVAYDTPRLSVPKSTSSSDLTVLLCLRPSACQYFRERNLTPCDNRTRSRVRRLRALENTRLLPPLPAYQRRGSFQLHSMEKDADFLAGW